MVEVHEFICIDIVTWMKYMETLIVKMINTFCMMGGLRDDCIIEQNGTHYNGNI